MLRLCDKRLDLYFWFIFIFWAVIFIETEIKMKFIFVPTLYDNLLEEKCFLTKKHLKIFEMGRF